MSGRQIGVFVLGVVLAMGALVAADHGLRARTGWIDPKRKNKDTNTAPFLAIHLVSPERRSRYLAKGLVGRANKAKSSEERARLLIEAVNLLKDKDDAASRIRLLQRVADECSGSPLSAEAVSRLIRETLVQKPPLNPAENVKKLTGLLQAFGVGKGKIPVKPIQDTIKALQKPYPAEAKTLQSALTAVTPKAKKKTSPPK